MRTLTLGLILPLAACAVTVPVGPPNPQVGGIADTTQGTIVVYRNPEAGFVGNVATTPAIAVDGVSAGECVANKPIAVPVAPGIRQVSAVANGSVIREVSIAVGDTVYLRCGTRDDPALRPAPALLPVDAATGAREARF